MIFFLSITFNLCFGVQKNRLIETVLLSTHNICKKNNFQLHTPRLRINLTVMLSNFGACMHGAAVAEWQWVRLGIKDCS